MLENVKRTSYQKFFPTPKSMQNDQHAITFDLTILQCITIRSNTCYHTSQMHTGFISEIYLSLLKQLLSMYFKLGLGEIPDRSR